MKKLFHITVLMLAAVVMTTQAVSAQSYVDRSRAAVSPFAQVIPGGAGGGGFYTFMAFSHPSLSDATSNIEITVSLEGTSTGQIVGGSSTTFTVGAGETHKVFVVASNHTVVNPTTNAGIFTARDHFITTTSSTFVTGNIRVLTTNTTPTVKTSESTYSNLNQISMWGVIFAEATNAGFAMEFIGDMHDSTLPATVQSVGTSGVPSLGSGIN